METNTPGNKRLYNASEIACPDSCNQPEQEKGCHFRMGPDRFTCTKCQLRIWRHFMGYELNATDLQEMLHGDKVTSTEKALTWKKGGQETTIRGRLVLNEEYKVRIAPKLKSKLPTDQACPTCKTGKLQLITAIDDSKWYGCNGYPQCRFTRPFIPHVFKTAPLTKNDDERSDDGKKKTGTSARKCESGGGHTQSAALGIKRPLSRETRSPATDEVEEVDNDRFRRIPRFILRMLKLDREPSVKSSDGAPLK